MGRMMSLEAISGGTQSIEFCSVYGNSMGLSVSK